MSRVTRFAPSPTGDLHLGHAYAAAFASRLARRAGGRFVLRIEDIDRERCREGFVAGIFDDLAWLGLAWEEPVLRQSARMDIYRDAIDRFAAMDVTYRCVCTRREIQAEIAAAGAAPHGDAGGDAYPGTCRRRPRGEVDDLIAGGAPYAVRLDARRALARSGDLVWSDGEGATHRLSADGVADVVVARKEMPTSYHVAVVVDDAAAGITHVTRGDDLLGATPVHRLLYALLGYAPPVWWHHPLCRDETGRRFAKRDRDVTLAALRAAGWEPAAVLAMAERAAGLPLPRVL